MKKILKLLTFLAEIPVLFSLAQVAYAATDICPPGDFNKLCTLKLEDSKIVGNIVTILLIFSIILALIFLIWGGIRWITSAGDKTKVDSARNTIIAAIVGLVIALLAFFILNAITFIITGKTFTSFTIKPLF